MSGQPAPSTAEPPASTPREPVNAVVQHVLTQLLGGEPCADRMATLCHDHAAELAAVPVPAAAAMIKSSVEAVTRALAAPAAAPADALTTLRHLLAHPTLRDVAIKASRLRSLATLVIEAASRGRGHGRADAAVAAMLRVLHETGVCVTTAGSLEPHITPLAAALQHSLLGAAGVLLDAGADINERSADSSLWPMSAALIAASDAGMTWLLERGVAHGSQCAGPHRRPPAGHAGERTLHLLLLHFHIHRTVWLLLGRRTLFRRSSLSFRRSSLLFRRLLGVCIVWLALAATRHRCQAQPAGGAGQGGADPAAGGGW